MNQQIKSHWRLAWRSFVKAIQVTIDTIKEDRRARSYRLKIAPDLRSQQDYIKMIEDTDDNEMVKHLADLEFDGEYYSKQKFATLDR